MATIQRSPQALARRAQGCDHGCWPGGPLMAKKLKVYGWQDYNPRTVKQCRSIMAAHSKAEVGRVIGRKLNSNFDCFCETGNRDEIDIATREPLTLFSTDTIDSRIYKKMEAR
jgi:hypothetical protein